MMSIACAPVSSVSGASGIGAYPEAILMNLRRVFMMVPFGHE